VDILAMLQSAEGAGDAAQNFPWVVYVPVFLALVLILARVRKQRQAATVPDYPERGARILDRTIKQLGMLKKNFSSLAGRIPKTGEDSLAHDFSELMSEIESLRMDLETAQKSPDAKFQANLRRWSELKKIRGRMIDHDASFEQYVQEMALNSARVASAEGDELKQSIRETREELSMLKQHFANRDALLDGEPPTKA